MKIMFIALIAFVAMVESQECEPEKQFKYYCNDCLCNADGTRGFCTLRGCQPGVWNEDGTRVTKADGQLEPIEPEQECEPYKQFKYYCNRCLCTSDGKKGVCTQTICSPGMYNRDGTPIIKHTEQP